MKGGSESVETEVIWLFVYLLLHVVLLLSQAGVVLLNLRCISEDGIS
jgi:hypothetical protein